MEQIIINQNRHWRQVEYETVFFRKDFDSLLEYLPMREILILTGIRRSGKSSMFRLLINYLMKDVNPLKILFINCEDPHFIQLCSDSVNLYRIIETAEKITQNKFEYLFIDEIQHIQNWQNFVKSIYETELFKKICITGSNSDLLENKYISLLAGRFIARKIFPLSFLEILHLNSIVTNFDLLTEKAKVQNLLDEYLMFGGFPEVFKTNSKELKYDLLSNYYQTIILKDCILNKNIRDKTKFGQLAFFIFNNINSLYSYNSLAKAYEGNENTVQSYIAALIDSYAVKEITNFRFSVKSNSKAKNKLYCIDNGLVNAVKYNYSEDKGKLFENLVFVEIAKKRHFEIFFFNDNIECDFIVKSKNDFFAIQVVYELTMSNIKREISGLNKVKQLFGIDNLMIVTYNQSENIEGCKVMTFVDFCFYLNNTEKY